MSTNNSTVHKFIQRLLLSEEYPCSYWDGKQQQIKAFYCNERLSDDALDILLANGFRRCGDFYYQNTCPLCRLCIPYRIVLNELILNRTQKRTINKNSGMILKVNQTPYSTDEKICLYLKYQLNRHKNSERFDDKEKNNLINSMQNQMFSNFGNTIELEYYSNDVLLGFAIFDVGKTSISAVYSVYDPDLLKNSMGNYIILSSMNWARENNFIYYYLGLFLENHEKMDYKKNFGLAEIYNLEKDLWVKCVKNFNRKGDQ